MSERPAVSDAGQAVADLVELMARLRQECPWDRKQTWADLRGYLLEECHEALEALDALDLPALEGELGDLLLQLVFLSRLGSEERAFDLASVARRIHAKMVARHPHIFGEADVRTAEGVRTQWEALKRKERESSGGASSPFQGLPASLPALLKALRISGRAADLGFDWIRDADVLAKLDEEVAEFRAELLDENAPRERAAQELGDILFTIVNVARRRAIDPEAALQGANARFARRFEAVVARLAENGKEPQQATLEEMDRLWNDVKAAER